MAEKGSTSSASRKKKRTAMATATATATATVVEDVGPAIGIDLGTTYSCVAEWQHDRVEIITNQGQRPTPSCVSFTDNAILVGDAAVSVAHTNALNTVYGVKHLIGRRFSDPNVQKDIKLWPFRVVAGRDDRPMIVVKYEGQEKRYYAQEISSMVLRKMKAVAETYFSCTIKDAVITVPAYFNDSQRRATKVAGAVAGLNVKRIMDEPTAAALAYGFDKIRCHSVPKNIFVFDLGGGTFDVSLVNISGGVFEVKATAGDTHLGGEDFDNCIVDHFVEEIKRKHNKDIRGNARALRKLRSACERAKRTLSTEDLTENYIDPLCDGLDFSSELSRAKFEELNGDLFSKCIELTKLCLRDAKIDKSNVDYVVLVGGSSRIPKVQQLLQDYFGIAILHRNVHPDEAVAYGAAVQAAKLSGQGNDIVNKVVLIDVTPLSLGLADKEDIMNIVVPRNTPIPTKGEIVGYTSYDNQIVVTFSVYEGERLQALTNHLLGEFSLFGIIPAPRGVAKFDVCFEIDEDGILGVSAKDRGTSQTNGITIKNDESWLRKDEIDKMIRDAEKYKLADEDYKRKIDARKELDNYAYDMRNTLRNPIVVSMVRLRESKLKKLEEAISQANCWLDKNKVPSVAATRAKLQKLKEVCEPIIGEMEDGSDGESLNS